MNDDQPLEARLRRYRPAGPPSRLRAACIDDDQADCRRELWSLATATALLLLATLLITMGSLRLHRTIADRRTDADVAGLVPFLANQAAATDDSRWAAERNVLQEQVRADLEQRGHVALEGVQLEGPGPQ